MADAAAPSTSRPPRAFVIVTALATLFFGVLSFTWFSLVVGWFETGEREIHRLHDVSWGALGGILIAGGVLVQLRNPERKVSAMQMVAAVVIVTAVASLLGEQVSPFLVPFLLLPALVVWFHPARAEILKPGAGISPILAGLAVIAAVPLIKWGFDQIDIQKAEPEGLTGAFADHWEEGHWFQMGALAFSLPVAGLIASMKTTGWLITARLAGAAAAVFGVASLVLDNYASALDTGWAWATLLGSLVFVAVAEWESRKEVALPPPAPPPMD